MVTPYDLRAAVASVLDTSDLTTPGDIALKVAENMPDEEIRGVLTEILPSYVRDMIAQRRIANPYLSGREARNAARSPKVAAIRDNWRAALRDRVHIGDGTWKMFGDCTYGDLIAAAEERRTLARANAVKAQRYQELAELLAARGVTTVADLPDADLREWGDVE